MKVVLTGRILKIFQTETVGSKNFQKRAVRIDVGQNGYSSVVDFYLTHDKVSIADKLSVGEEVEVTASLVGRLYTGQDGVERNFLEVQAYKVTKIGKVVL